MNKNLTVKILAVLISMLTFCGMIACTGGTVTSGNSDSQNSGLQDETSNSSELVEGCNHQWIDATCTVARTCELCGETEGEVLGHNYNGGATCQNCGNTLYVFDESGNYMYFGSYPQTRVIDETLIEALSGYAGALPTFEDAGAWTDYKYWTTNYNGNAVQTANKMWYIDQVYEGEKYRGVYICEYRYIGKTIYQEKNGYLVNNVYWFKYEPIKWSKYQAGSKVQYFTTLIIDSQEYYASMGTRKDGATTIYPNNYKESYIRSWLNETFLNLAFTEIEQSIIKTTEVDNSYNTMEYSSYASNYDCENTMDKVYMFSYQELKYWQMTRKVTDYAMSQGLATKDGIGLFWLRSPASSDQSTARIVNYQGQITNAGTQSPEMGVVPVIQIVE